MTKHHNKPPDKPEENKLGRNPAFEAEMAKNKPRRDFLKTAREEAYEFIKSFQLNWSYRNDIAKTVITLSSALLALLITLASKSFFISISPILLVSEIALLIFVILINLISLWIILRITLIYQDFMVLEPRFAAAYEQMIKEKKQFDPDVFHPFFLAPVAKAWKHHRIAYNFLRAGMVLFFVSLLLFCVLGFKAMPDKPDLCMNLKRYISENGLMSSETSSHPYKIR